MFDDENDDYFGDDLKMDMERFERFLQGEPIGFLDSDRWEALVDNYLISGFYNKALKAAKEALSQFSYNDLFRLREAQAYSGLGHLKNSLNILQELEDKGISSFELVMTKAAVFSQLKDANSAIRAFREAIALAGREERDEVYIDLAVEYQNKDDFDSSIKVLEEALAINPHNEVAVYELAHCYEHLGDLEKAVKCYSDFIDENPYSFTAWYNLGNTYSRLENFDKAIWAYDYCLLINEKFGPVHFNMGNAYLNLDKYTKAIEAFNESIRLDGDDPVAYSYIGECHEQLGELELAKLYYSKSVELAPALPEAWLGLGIVADLEGNTKEGLQHILRAQELDPTNAGIVHVLAGAYEKLDDREQANECYLRALDLDPHDEECLSNYIDFLKEVSPIEAYHFIDEYSKDYPEMEIAVVIRISLLWDMGRKYDAVHLFKDLVNSNRDLALELFRLSPALKSVPEFVLLGDQ